MYPNDLKYTDTHEWARADEKAGTATVGVSDYAIKQLGDIVFLDLPAIGAKLKKGSSFGTIESVKAVSDLNAPVTGSVVEVNTKLVDSVETLQTDAYVKGWMVKIKVENKVELKSLMSAADYEAFVSKNKEQGH